MTFLEAAIEVLRHESGPLHYGEIARRAVDRKLLSHVGRDPEAAMKSCLMSAVRGGNEAAVERVKPGHYQVRDGASLPELKMPDGALGPDEVDDDDADEGEDKKTTKKSGKKKSGAKKASKKSGDKSSKKSGKKSSKKSSKSDANDDGSADEGDDASAKTGKAAKDVEHAEDADGAEDGAGEEGAASGNGAASKVRFEAPAGSGLEGVTDVALVMANAMSRLADERPELRQELEAMQQGEAQVPEIKHKPTLRGEPGQRGRNDRNDRNDRHRGRDNNDDDRGSGRRRRRRRRRTKRVEWSEALDASGDQSATQLLLEKAEKALSAAGSRSLHVRQVAEALSADGILGGEISEIERAVTAAMLLDVRRHGDRSRFIPRGDARYQLRATRVPEKAAVAENALRSAWLTLENETRTQLRAWLGSLGARALETLVRMHVEHEGHRLLATLPPGRGLSKLLIEDSDADGENDRVLVLIVPRKTTVEPRLWEEDPERGKCGGVWVFAMGDPKEAGDQDDVRLTGSAELADWLIRERIGVKTLEIKVPVLDPTLIESIAGLDT